jgi:hypothetical protein
MKPEEVDEATHEVTVDGLMREEIALELLELQKVIASEIREANVSERQDIGQEDERMKVLKDEN